MTMDLPPGLVGRWHEHCRAEWALPGQNRSLGRSITVDRQHLTGLEPTTGRVNTNMRQEDQVFKSGKTPADCSFIPVQDRCLRRSITFIFQTKVAGTVTGGASRDVSIES